MTKHDERIIVKSIRSTGKTGMQKNKIKYAHAKKNDAQGSGLRTRGNDKINENR